MANIQSNFIDFRNEHRIYLLNGSLQELVGMIAVTVYDDQNENTESFSASPRTWYKLIFDSQCMFDGGYYSEGSLPLLFAHCGDTISFPMLSSILLNNLFYNIEEPIFILEEILSKFHLHVDTSKLVSDISVRLCDLKRFYSVEMNFVDRIVDKELFNFHYPEKGKKGIICHFDGIEEFFSYKRLASALGEILYALREYFKRQFEIVSIEAVRYDDTPIDLPESYNKFIRLINIAAEIQRRYWKKKIKYNKP